MTNSTSCYVGNGRVGGRRRDFANLKPQHFDKFVVDAVITQAAEAFGDKAGNAAANAGDRTDIFVPKRHNFFPVTLYQYFKTR